MAMGGNNTVEKAVNKRFVGVAHAIRDGYALVQTGGFAVLGYSGNAPAVGFAKMQADANADAVLNEGGGEVLVTEVDTVNKKRRHPVLEAEKSEFAKGVFKMKYNYQNIAISRIFTRAGGFFQMSGASGSFRAVQGHRACRLRCVPATAQAI